MPSLPHVLPLHLVFLIWNDSPLNGQKLVLGRMVRRILRLLSRQCLSPHRSTYLDPWLIEATIMLTTSWRRWTKTKVTVTETHNLSLTVPVTAWHSVHTWFAFKQMQQYGTFYGRDTFVIVRVDCVNWVMLECPDWMAYMAWDAFSCD